MALPHHIDALEHEPVGKLLLQYSMPAIAGMAAMSLYNVIDSAFIGYGVGAHALAALAVAFPIMNLGTALGTLVGLGGASASSITLGRKDRAAAFRVLGHCTVLSLLFGVLFGWCALPFLDDLLILFGASRETLPYARDFMFICLLIQPLTYCLFNLNHIIRSTGYPRKAMNSLLLSVVCNVVLAPIFIFALEWGMTGAALATALSQTAALIRVLRHFADARSTIHFIKGICKLDYRLAGWLCFLGLPPCIVNAGACLVTVIVNRQLLFHGGDMAVGAFGIINRLLILFSMLVVGITQGMQPIAGYNLGAGRFGRVKKVLWCAIFAATAVTTAGFVSGEFAPHWIVALFTNEPALADIAIPGLRRCLIIFPLVGSQIVIGNFFQAIGRPKLSVFLSLTRQILFLMPLLFILPEWYGLYGVWYSYAASDALSIVVGFGTLYCFFRHFLHSPGAYGSGSGSGREEQDSLFNSVPGAYGSGSGSGRELR